MRRKYADGKGGYVSDMPGTDPADANMDDDQALQALSALGFPVDSIVPDAAPAVLSWCQAQGLGGDQEQMDDDQQDQQAAQSYCETFSEQLKPLGGPQKVLSDFRSLNRAGRRVMARDYREALRRQR